MCSSNSVKGTVSVNSSDPTNARFTAVPLKPLSYQGKL